MSDNNPELFAELNNFKLYQSYAGEIRFGPIYLILLSKPEIPNLSWTYYGDWFFYFKHYIFLQQWNSIERPDTNIVLINTLELTAKTLRENIPSVLWEMVVDENGFPLLSCDTGRDISKFQFDEL